MTRVVLAVPTIEARRHRRPDLERLWMERTPDSTLEIIYSDAGTSWGDGLNAIWAQISDNPPDMLILGSDDMVPGDDHWLPVAQAWLDNGFIPAPRVEDPRFTNCGGHLGAVPEGVPADMTAFIIIRGDWGDDVFPMPEGLHYFADNYACLMLSRAGRRIVTSPSCRIIHMHAAEGRGAGYGSENTRLYIDTVRYTRALDELGIDREGLAPGVRGAMWEPHFIEIGTLAGA